MKKFRVNLYYHGCYSVDVEANDENEARGIATEHADALNDRDFMSAIDLIEDDHDVYEI